MRTKSLLLALALLPPSAADAQQKLDEKRSASMNGVVEIDNPRGTITVIGWNKPEIAVTGSVGRGADGVDISGGQRRISISIDAMNPHGVRSDLEIHVPAGSRLEIDAFASEVRVTDMNGSISVDSVNGSMSLSGGFEEVSAETVNGSIEISGPAKRVHAENVNGPLTIRGGSGEIDATTVNGKLLVSGGSFDHVQLETVSGSIVFEGELPKQATLDAQSVSGNVGLVLPARIAADFSATTFSGEIVNELGPPAERTSKYTTEKELEFSTGGGVARVSLETLSGTISIRKRP